MALVVEDGTGLANAESYISVADADTYHSKMGNSDWENLESADKEACLRRAAQFMVAVYRLKWQGRRVKQEQKLDWPRVGVVIKDLASSAGYLAPASYGLFQVDYNVVPDEVKNACAELALRASIGQLAPDLSQRVVSETIGPITVNYDRYSPQSPRYTEIDLMLSPFFGATANPAVVKLSRS
jgi:hypothetical protein